MTARQAAAKTAAKKTTPAKDVATEPKTNKAPASDFGFTKLNRGGHAR